MNKGTNERKWMDGRTNEWIDRYHYFNRACYQIIIQEILKFGLHKIRI